MMKYLLYAGIVCLSALFFGLSGCCPCQGISEEVHRTTNAVSPSEAGSSGSDSKEKERSPKPKHGTITPKELYQLQKENKKPLIIDVRTPQEYRTIHVPTAILVPLDELDVEKTANEYKLKDKTFYLICRSGRRSGVAADKFIDAGIGKPVNVTGGTLQWDKEGYPVIKENK